MSQSLLSAELLLGCRLRTADGAEAGLTDLILDTEQWSVQFLAVDAQRWALDRDLVLTPRLLSGVDEARRELTLGLTGAELRASPQLDMDDEGFAGFDNAAETTPAWRRHWQAEMQPEAGVDPPPPPAEEDEVAADLGAETQVSAEQLVRMDVLRTLAIRATDGVDLRVEDLLIDDSDWSLAYLQAVLPADASAGAHDLRCLVPRQGIQALDRAGEMLHLGVSSQQLRDAPQAPLPVTTAPEDATAHVLSLSG
jgi:hypothetical protein